MWSWLGLATTPRTNAFNIEYKNVPCPGSKLRVFQDENRSKKFKYSWNFFTDPRASIGIWNLHFYRKYATSFAFSDMDLASMHSSLNSTQKMTSLQRLPRSRQKPALSVYREKKRISRKQFPMVPTVELFWDWRIKYCYFWVKFVVFRNDFDEIVSE